jgi:hypothetical protein
MGKITFNALGIESRERLFKPLPICKPFSCSKHNPKIIKLIGGPTQITYLGMDFMTIKFSRIFMTYLLDFVPSPSRIFFHNGLD